MLNAAISAGKSPANLALQFGVGAASVQGGNAHVFSSKAICAAVSRLRSGRAESRLTPTEPDSVYIANAVRDYPALYRLHLNGGLKLAGSVISATLPNGSLATLDTNDCGALVMTDGQVRMLAAVDTLMVDDTFKYVFHRSRGHCVSHRHHPFHLLSVVYTDADLVVRGLRGTTPGDNWFHLGWIVSNSKGGNAGAFWYQQIMNRAQALGVLSNIKYLLSDYTLDMNPLMNKGVLGVQLAVGCGGCVPPSPLSPLSPLSQPPPPSNHGARQINSPAYHSTRTPLRLPSFPFFKFLRTAD